MRCQPRIVRPLFVVALLSAAAAAPVSGKGPAYTDPRQADADFAYQGEYAGTLKLDDGDQKLGVQVIALGKGRFRAAAYLGGLPGAGWDGSERHLHEGERRGDEVVFDSEDAKARGVLGDGKMTITIKASGTRFVLDRVERVSPTMGKKPPAGAVVLFDGGDAKAWKGGRVSEDGYLVQGCTSIPTFGSHKLHIEFRLPYQPEDQGQARGNSGVYLQGRYEVQMLDSFGLEGKHNECGGIYEVKAPDTNMCLPPLAWQTYDIEFHAARYQDGQVVRPPRMTVVHNGVKIHDDVPLPKDRGTRAAPVKVGPEPGPVYLQNHGNPVRYRNIWVVPLDE